MDSEGHRTTPSNLEQTGPSGEEHGGLKHLGLMILCCLPMIALFILIALGVWRW